MRMALVWLVLGAACGKAYLDPVVLEAQSEVPAVMWLQDRSGSLAAALSPDAACGGCFFPNCNEANCPTRMGLLQTWKTGLLNELGGQARWGLTVFPGAASACSPAGAADVLQPIADASSSLSVEQRLAQLSVSGGTPTGASLQFVSGRFLADTAERLVLLVTDGAPNCNAENPNTCLQPTACRCTLANGNCGTAVDDGNPNNFCRRGCLDAQATVAAASALAAMGISTLVVGLAVGTQPADSATLDEVARAGLSGVRCAADSDCFGFRCESGRCAGAALRLETPDSSAAISARLRQRLELSQRCRWSIVVPLASPPTAVELEGRPVPAAEVVVEAPSRIRLVGEACRRLVADRGLTPSFFAQP